MPLTPPKKIQLHTALLRSCQKDHIYVVGRKAGEPFSIDRSYTFNRVPEILTGVPSLKSGKVSPHFYRAGLKALSTTTKETAERATG